MTASEDLPDLILRLARLAEGEGWAHGLNPAQAAALAYLARANRFSRAPSQLADWLGTTRGTVSQTLKALAAKGLVAEAPSPRDRRSISYALTEAGLAAQHAPTTLTEALRTLREPEAQAAARVLGDLLRRVILAKGNRPFGMCRTCRHHQPNPDGSAHCALLSVALLPEEAGQICAEHAA